MESETQPQTRNADKYVTDAEFLNRLREGIRIGLIRGLLAVLVTAIIYALWGPNFLESAVRSKVSRVRTDLRHVSIAIEGYFIDYAAYPPGYRYVGTPPKTLTTPLAYITSLPADAHGLPRMTYERIKPRWFLWMGPVALFLIGVAAFLAAVVLFLTGKGSRRYAVVLALGYAGLCWTALSVSPGIIASTETGPFHEMVSGPATYLGGWRFVFLAVGLAAFGSGIRRGMKGTRWCYFPGWEVIAIVLWCCAFVGTYNLAATSARVSTSRKFPGVPFDPPFRYATDGKRSWLLWSQGPDGSPNIPELNLPFLLQDNPTSEVVRLLLPFSYDPTNGTVSRGDIWRIKQ